MGTFCVPPPMYNSGGGFGGGNIGAYTGMSQTSSGYSGAMSTSTSSVSSSTAAVSSGTSASSSAGSASSGHCSGGGGGHKLFGCATGPAARNLPLPPRGHAVQTS